MLAFIHALWIMDPSKCATSQICSQALKTMAAPRVTSMLCVTDNKPVLIPYSLQKGTYCSTCTQNHHFT